MKREQITEAYKIAKEHAQTIEEAVQVGIQMAINGEVVFDKDKIQMID